MLSQILNKLNIALISFTVIILLGSCNAQSKQLEDCQLSYKNAKADFSTYYKINEKLLLNKSLNNVEQALKCKETRYKAIDLKISLLILLKKYRNGYKFIDSLSEKDFKKGYKKKMNYNYFLALEHESKTDTVNRNKYFNYIIVDIQNYIQQEKMSKGKFDKEAYYDLFFVKKNFLNLQQVNAEVDLLKEQYPNEKDFFDSLKETLINAEPKTTSAPN